MIWKDCIENTERCKLIRIAPQIEIPAFKHEID